MFFSCTPNNLLELVPETEADLPPTLEELAKADEIIYRGLNRAMKADSPSAEKIWTDFNTVQTRIATHISVQIDTSSE